MNNDANGSPERAVRFNPPELPQHYGAMDHTEFMQFVELSSTQNEAWIRQNLPPEARWGVVQGGILVDHGFGFKVPNEIEIRGYRGKTANDTPYLLTRKISRQDLEIFFRTPDMVRITGLVQRTDQDFETYLQATENTSTGHLPSGSLNKLKDSFALGALGTQIPLTPDRDERHSIGATTAKVHNWQALGMPNRTLYFSSQFLEHIHARGLKTEADRDPSILRVERLHRFDDPIADILDTYDVMREEGWPSIILYRGR